METQGGLLSWVRVRCRKGGRAVGVGAEEGAVGEVVGGFLLEFEEGHFCPLGVGVGRLEN